MTAVGDLVSYSSRVSRRSPRCVAGWPASRRAPDTRRSGRRVARQAVAAKSARVGPASRTERRAGSGPATRERGVSRYDDAETVG